MMRISRLYYFKIVAKNLSFTKAAKECHISQPALSKQISLLENTLGFPVFDRNAGRIRLTPAGKAYYESVCHLLEQFESSLCSLQVDIHEL